MKLVAIGAVSVALIAAWGWTQPHDRDAVERQRSALAQFWPVIAAALAAGFFNGLAWREQSGTEGGYASPMKAWMAKRVAVSGGVILASWWCTPLPFGGELLWSSAAALMGGVAVYVGNLPARL